MTTENAERYAGKIIVFSLVFPVVYTAAYYNEWVLFRFYPLVGEVHLDVQPIAAGPAMIYYGWLALSFLAAFVTAALLPNKWGARIPTALTLFVPVAATLFMFLYETRWFLH